MRLILLALLVLVAAPTRAAEPEVLADFDARFLQRADAAALKAQDAALGVGAYAQAVGILKALGDGLESKFNERLDKALQLDPDFLWGAPLLTKGRYYFELPWPKRDLAKSASFYEKALAKSPGNLRTWYFLAETLLKDGKARKARDAIEQVKQGSTAYDPAEGRRVQELAKKLDSEIGEELK